MYVHGSEERLIQAPRGQKRWFRSCKCFEEIKEGEKIRRLWRDRGGGGGGGREFCMISI